jgi:transcriptional regulator with XRE-family HTH domain
VNAAQRFGKNLARQRRLADMSQDEVAFRAGVHRTEVSQLERGLRHARVDTVAKLAAALEINPGNLFEGIVWEPGNVRVGRFIAQEVPGLGTVQRSVKVERPADS